jgi:hypothetical protein
MDFGSRFLVLVGRALFLFRFLSHHFDVGVAFAEIGNADTLQPTTQSGRQIFTADFEFCDGATDERKFLKTASLPMALGTGGAALTVAGRAD